MRTMARLLFITSNRLGDAVLSTGVLARLIDETPTLAVTVACGPLPAPLFRAVPGLDRVIPLPKKRFARHWLDLWLACVGTRWDHVVDLRNSAVSRLLWTERRTVHRARPSCHKVEELGALVTSGRPPSPRLWLDDAARAEADRRLGEDHRPLLALGPTANWRGKEWPTDRFTALARRLVADDGPLSGGSVAVLAAPEERGRAAPLLDALGDRAIDLVGATDPMTAAAVLERASLFVGNDSGLMHLAAAVGVRAIGLFGPGYPETYGPWGPLCRAVTGSIARDRLLERMRGGDAGLMDGISVEAVVEAATGLLEREPA